MRKEGKPCYSRGNAVNDLEGKMRGLIAGTIAVVAIGLSGCPTLEGACHTDADCAAGQYCDPVSEACFAKDGGPGDKDGGVDAGACPEGCDAWEECAGNACVARYESVAITEPASGQQSPGAEVAVKAVLTLAEGRTANPPDKLTLEVTAPGATMATTHELTKSGEEYAGTFTLGTDEGEYTLVAKYADAALESPAVTLSVDATAPTFEIDVTPAPARDAPVDGTTYGDIDAAYQTAYQRDEVVEIHVSSTAMDVDPASVKLGAQFGNGAAASQFDVVAADSSECAGAPYCGKLMLNAWEPEMKAFRDALALTVDGKDLSGNVADQATGSVKVTRWKWAHTVDVNPVKASPAIASDGTIVVGSTNSSTTGKLQAVRPDGTLRWTKDTIGAIEGSPAVGALNGTTQYVYALANSTTTFTSKLYAFDLDGTEVASCEPPIAGAGDASIAVHMTQYSTETSPTESATTVVNGVPALLTIRPAAPLKCLFASASETADFPATVAVKGLDLYFGDINGSIRGFSFESTGWAVKTGWPVSGISFPRSLAISGSDIVVGAGSGLFTIPETGSASDWNVSTTAAAWSPVVGPGNVAFFGQNNKFLTSVTLGDAPSKFEMTTSGVPRAAPIVGEGGRLFSVTFDGMVHSVLLSPIGAPRWDVGGLGSLESSPNLDCTRDGSGSAVPGRPGVLYVGSGSGKLYAFIVDSRGIDTSAPWPKYQHDPRNTGNADTPLSSFACP